MTVRDKPERMETLNRVTAGRRVQFGSMYLSDFDLDVNMLFRLTDDSVASMNAIALTLRRNEVQKLFDELWKYSFRPTE